jgi:N-dimethylarginine dimethylaminohydrolase
MTPVTRVLMADPEFFRVEYAINPHMRDASGALREVDPVRARAQWKALGEKFGELGVQVSVLDPVPGLPDLVFTANQSFPFLDPKTGLRTVVLSRMRAPERRPEVALFREWYVSHGYVIEAEPSAVFEGNGDALVDPGTPGRIWGGFGFRTEESVYSELEMRFGFRVERLRLVDPDFYHLDTCFSILSVDSVAIVPRAFDAESLRKIDWGFRRVIEVPYSEAREGFAGNCWSPNGRDVVVQRGNMEFVRHLKAEGFWVHEVDTSEFMKSGGSVFCMKMALP